MCVLTLPPRTSAYCVVADVIYVQSTFNFTYDYIFGCCTNKLSSQNIIYFYLAELYKDESLELSCAFASYKIVFPLWCCTAKLDYGIISPHRIPVHSAFLETSVMSSLMNQSFLSFIITHRFLFYALWCYLVSCLQRFITGTS